MKGSSTIRTDFPATPESLRGIQLEPDDEEEELTTVLSSKTVLATAGTDAKTIPFGSTLATKPLRVRLERGAVLLMMPDGRPVGVEHLPKWEQQELFRHVADARLSGRL